MGETPATNGTQTETPASDNTADPASESTPPLPCNVAIADKAASSMGETPATNGTQTETPASDNTADPASESTPPLPPESETLLLTPASSSLTSPISFTTSLSSPMSLSVAPQVSPLTQPVFKFSQPSRISSSLASPLPPASTLSAASKLTAVPTELGSPDSVSSSGKKRQIKRKAEPRGPCGGFGAVASLLWMWDEVEKLLGATRKYSKFILKMCVFQCIVCC
ncbi:uncharacterized protein LOC131546197 [Onychostoma macrolepis]|uniref:uncharacterized protein LOC131546197 n=1 Tax=Onychostoma macrolepis TaxID=369639 RepID=UPI00272D21A8|nr:uncharacterized protein LOC131546197 [Onychostoma macrolepis]